MTQLTINGRTIEARPGQSLLAAALAAGTYIPHLCAHPDLPVHGGCKVCTVEIAGVAEPVQACETVVGEGMVVSTRSPAADHVRTVALELMLASHPTDCTSCAAYLNCELQALMQYTGVAHSRLREINKVTARIGAPDALISRETFRCISCTRCIRACADLRGVGVLTINHEQGETYVGTVGGRPLAETDCRFCGACVEVCPTGAIMDMPGVFSTDVPRPVALVPCANGCPAHTDIPLYLELANQGRYADSAAVFREKLTFPLSLGYICTHPCEASCKRGRLDFPLAIREIKRFVAENDTEQYWRRKATPAPPTGRSVAVVGGGPAGLTAAYYLARKGHAVTVLERLPKPGGMLRYGIPRQRLPREVVDGEIAILRHDAGFAVELGVDATDVRDLRARYDAVLVATGAQAGRRPPGLDRPWPNVHAAVDLCRRWNLGERPDLGDIVTVYGGGSVAFDAARSARAAGASVVRLLCLEPATAMLVDPEEVRAAQANGIEVVNSVSLVDVVEVGGLVSGLRFVDVRSFRFTDAGLELDVVEGSERVLATDSFVLALGQCSDLTEAFGLDLGRGGFVRTGPEHVTSLVGVFAAGDAVTGTRSVVAAIADARAAASSVDRYLGGDGVIEDRFYEREPHRPALGVTPNFSGLPRTNCRTAEAMVAETSRCLHCELRRDIETVKYWADPAYRAQPAVAR